MRTALVTGGAGFIGSHLVEALVKEGWKVTVVDNLATGKLSNLDGVLSKIDFVEADIRDRTAMEKVCEGVEVVFHEAALASVPRSMAEPWETTDVNILGTLSVLEAAAHKGVRRVVAASSSSVYGNAKRYPVEEDDPLSPLSPYAASKLCNEHYLKVFNDSFGVETVALRYFNVFGPRQSPDSPYAPVIPKFISLMKEGKNPVVFGDGTQARDFVYVENVVMANLLAADSPEAKGEVFNISGGQPITILELVDMLNELLDTSLKPRLAPPRPGDPKKSSASLKKAKEILGFEIKVPFKEGLRRTVKWALRSASG